MFSRRRYFSEHSAGLYLMIHFLRVCICLVLCIFVSHGPALAQNAKPSGQEGAAGNPPIPNPYALNMMIRSSVIALNHANKTGNYSVLLDLGAPAFRASNNSASLARIFSALRQRNLDLSPILFFMPKLFRPPVYVKKGVLRLSGYFPTTPERVDFEIFIQKVGSEWRLFGIGVSTTPAMVTSAAPPRGNNNQQSQSVSSAASAQKPIAPPPARRPQGLETPERIETAVKNSTTSDAVRIDLSKMREAPKAGAAGAVDGGSNAATADDQSSFWGKMNPFSSD